MENVIQPAEAHRKLRTFKQFLESAAPDSREDVSERAGPQKPLRMNQTYRDILTPNLDLYCEICGGERIFENANETEVGSLFHDGETPLTLIYVCRNCKKSSKTYHLIIRGINDTGPVQKVGEYPTFSPPTPRRLFELIGEGHREMFLKGRRAEFRGLGIGAYAYYRRIVEDQKNAIINEIIEVAKKVGTSAETLKTLEELKDEKQFKKAIENLKKGFPESLLIDGHHNPLLLLHNALSRGIHEMSDEDCLKHATSIRIVLSELAERIAAVLKEKSELSKAVGYLLRV